MGEAKIKSIREVEGRAALQAASARRSRLRDRFGRGIDVNDMIMLAQATPTDVVWRVVQVTPSTEPQAQGGYWADVVAQTRVLFRPGMPSEYVILLVPANPVPGADRGDTPDRDDRANTADTPEPSQPPGEIRSPGGIILSDPDGRQSDR